MSGRLSGKLRVGSALIKGLLIAVVVLSIAGTLMTRVPEDASREALSFRYNLIALFFVINAVSVAAVLWMLVTRNMLRRITALASKMDQGAAGDLSVSSTEVSDDEVGLLGRSFNRMVDTLSGTVKRVNQAIQELRKISSDIKEVSTCAVAAASLQSDGVRETSAAVQEINKSVQGVARSVDSLSRSATENASSIMEMSATIEEVSRHMESLTSAVDEVSTSIFEMAAAEKEIGNSINTLMQESMAAASSVAEMDLSIKQVEQHAVETSQISEKVRKDADGGREAVDATISGIGEIRKASRIAYESVQTLSLRARDIGTILSVIDDLAEQTNLLALNASIIAAQAGEHGKGFAVVADEIKELARRTSSSTKEIDQIVKGVQEETNRAVKAIGVAEQRVAEGEGLSYRSGEALRQIVSGVQMATERVTEIARTTVEQARGSQAMRGAMERVSEMVGQIAKATREQAHGTELITSAAEQMKDLTSQVRVSMQEQRTTSSLIVRATEDISHMIEKIREACEHQADSSRSIVQAVDNIEQSTRTTVEAAQVMDGAVTGLSTQIDSLQAEVSGFTYR